MSRVRETTYYSDGTIRIHEYHNGRYGAPGSKRQERKRPTPEAVRKNNIRVRMQHLRDLLIENFRPGDYWVTLTYRKENRPGSLKEAMHDAELFRNRLKKYFRKAGIDLKWMQTSEIGSRGAAHHHMVINRIPGLDRFLAKEWKKGKVYFQLLYVEGRYQDLAEYMAKDEGRESKRTHSRNLSEPRRTREVMRGTFKPLRSTYKGLVLDKESVVEGTNVFGFSYRIAEYIKARDD